MTLQYQELLDGLTDAVIGSDGDDRITYVNPAAERLLGWSADALIGRPLTVLMPPRMHSAHERGYQRFVRTREPKIMRKPVRVPALHRDGAEIDIELSLSAYPQADGGLFILASMRDLRERVELERKLATQRLLLAQHAVTGVLAKAQSAEQAIETLLPTLGETLDWDAVLYWKRSPARDVLELAHSWLAPDAPFAGALARRPRTLKRGEGFAGEVWAAEEPAWRAGLDGGSPDDDAPAPAEGSGGTLLWPIIHAGKVHGVVELLGRAREAPTAEHLRSVRALGLYTGQSLARLDAEEAATEKSEWLNTVLMSIGDAVIATDTRGEVSFMNPVAEGLTGWRGEEAFGRPLEEVFPIIHEETRERIETPVDVVLRDRRIVTLANHTALIARDGSERVIEDSAAPIIHPGTNELHGVVLVFRDVTEKKRLQTELARLFDLERAARDEAERARQDSEFLDEATTLLGSSLDYQQTLRRLAGLAVPRLADWCAIHLVAEETSRSEQLVVAHVDPAKVEWARELQTRYPSDPSAPRGAPAVSRTGRPELYPKIADELLVSLARNDEHLDLLRQVGMKSAMIVPLTSRAQIFGAMTFVISESDRRYDDRDLAFALELARRAGQAIDNARLYNEAREAVRVRDDFFSIASHELRTPLTPLQLQLQAMIRDSQSDAFAGSSEHVTSKLGTISRQVTRLEKLITNLLEISRITGGRLSLENEELDLVLIARDIVERFRAQAEQLGMKVMLYTPSSIIGRWDRLRLEQVIGNLLSNALKFGERRPVEIRLDLEESAARIQVVDHGIGISSADQKRIFERFERAVPTRHFGGFGLGLWIARQIVEAMGGTIDVRSAEGEGSVFDLTIPLEPPETLDAPDTDESAEHAADVH